MTALPAVGTEFDVARIRRDFPVLRSLIQGKPLVYFDNAATSQKPRAVVEAEADFALLESANVHRGVHTLSSRATDRFDEARAEVQRFLGARRTSEIVFTSGTTAAVNLLAHSLARPRLRPGDEILVTEMEHHSNLIPWQLAASATGASIRAIPVTPQGELDLSALERLLTSRTRIVAVTHVSNVVGTVNPVRRIADQAHAAGALVVVDGAQAVPHLPVDVEALGADFYAASAHKMFGPTGIGFLYGREDLLASLSPAFGGGGTIQRVTIDSCTYAPVPERFEAGTPPISQAVGLAAAIRWMRGLDWTQVEAHEADLLRYAAEALAALPGIRLIGAPAERVGVLSFTMDEVHPHDIGTVLDSHGVAVRAGHHCAQPLMDRLGLPATVRASFALYNTRAEVDALVEAVRDARRIFG